MERLSEPWHSWIIAIGKTVEYAKEYLTLHDDPGEAVTGQVIIVPETPPEEEQNG